MPESETTKRPGLLSSLLISFFSTIGCTSVATSIAGPGSIPITNLKTDEHVLLFPTNATFDKATKQWELDIHGWVFEPERDSIWRNGLIKSLASFVDVEDDTEEKKRFEDRTSMFLVDNERNKSIVVEASQQYFTSPKTGANGHFRFNATFKSKDEACNNWLTLKVHTNKNDNRKFNGRIQCMTEDGISVISDIDDTIKDSHVLDKKLLLKKTFLKEFASVKGMSDIYQHWQSNGYQFHYVSSSPWQLYPVLSDFIDDQSFPRGSMHLKLIRLKDQSIMNLFASPEDGKIPTITTLLMRFPKRKFILVGDSGEKDPDIYAKMAREHPERIIRIYIRDVKNDKASVEKIFAGLPKDKWVVFQDSSEILGQHALLNPVN